MRKLICLLPLFLWSVAAWAQESKIPQMLEIVQVENDAVNLSYEVLNIPKDGVNHYYLDMGTLGIGDEVIQVHVDPLFRLFIPLGNSLEGALEKMIMIKDQFQKAPGSFIEVEGCLAAAFPTDELETVTITTRKLMLSRKLEFSLQREDYIRATYISKSDFASLVGSLKFYRKLHPKE